MSNWVHKFELARDPSWSDEDYLERRNRHDAEMRRRVSVMLKDAAGLVLDLMLAVPADADPDIADLMNRMSIAERLDRTAEFWGWSNPVFEIALTEFRRAIGQVRDLIAFQRKRK